MQEIANLLQLTACEPIAVPIFLASFYGLRRSELLGLRWSAIDFQQGTISISTTVVKEKHYGEIKAVVRENPTKSDTSMRTLPLCQYTYQYFDALHQRQAYQKDLCGACYDQRFLDFVCVDQMGTLIQPDYVSQKFQAILHKYGLRRIRFHDLRHTFATTSLEQGMDVVTLSRLLGHANPSITMDKYGHALDDHKRASIGKLDGLYAGAKKTLSSKREQER